VSSFTQVVILCEDRQQEFFARHFLKSCGIDDHRLRAKVCPKGKMSGEQFVRDSYASEVRAHRSRSSYQNIALVVMTDADVKSAQKKYRELDETLVAAGELIRKTNERIAVFLPKRNIETWIHFLMGEPVDETGVYSKLKTESDSKALVVELAAKPQYRLTDDVPSSLREACSELRRILPSKQCMEAQG
jgi:hypothetical protein